MWGKRQIRGVRGAAELVPLGMRVDPVSQVLAAAEGHHVLLRGPHV